MSDSRYVSCRVDADDLSRFIRQALGAVGADEASRQAVARALVTASLMGTDSHGLRLLPHYLNALEGGRIAPSPRLAFTRRLAGTGVLDAGNALGHLAG